MQTLEMTIRTWTFIVACCRLRTRGWCQFILGSLGALILCPPGSALAAVELEPNNDLASANVISNGESNFGQLSSDKDVDWFKFQGDVPKEIPLAFKCNQAAGYYYYYNPYFYTVSAYNRAGSVVASYLIPLSFCAANFGAPYIMHLNGSENGVAMVSIGAKTDTTTCAYCSYYDFPNYTSEYSISLLPADTVTQTIKTNSGAIRRGSKIHKDLRDHADSANLTIRGCEDQSVNASIIIKANRLKLEEITPETTVALQIGNWRCDATGNWRSSLYSQGTEYKVRRR